MLAYSGGLDTSVILKWLQQTYDGWLPSLPILDRGKRSTGAGKG